MFLGHQRFTQHAVVYIDREGQRAIVSTVHHNGSPNGILLEDENPVVLLAPLATPALGSAVCTAMRSSEIRKERSCRDDKLTDWPAFRASRSKSVHAFEADYISIRVKGANDANIIYVLEGLPSKNSDLAVQASISSSAKALDLTSLCLRVWRACRDRSLA